MLQIYFWRLMLSAIPLPFFVSCDLYTPPVLPKVSFSSPVYKFSEDAGIINIQLQIDKPLQRNITVDFDITSSATPRYSLSQRRSPDYLIEGISGDVRSRIFYGTGRIEFKAGETSSTLEIELINDFFLEGTESIDFEISEINGNAEIGNAKTAHIELVEEPNGLKVELDWDYQETAEVDMDLIGWYEEIAGSNIFSLIGFSAGPSYVESEFMYIPATAKDGKYGFSYVLWGTALTPPYQINFNVNFIKVTNSIEGTVNTFHGTYSDLNVNPFDDFDELVNIEQYVEKSGSNFNYSSIAIPDSSSRVRPNNFHLQKKPDF